MWGDNHDLRVLDIEGFTGLETLSYFGSGDFSQIQDAADGTWAGAEVRTQSSAQEALEQLQRAIEKKDRIRTNLGTLQNRLENTITNLTIQLENVQKAEAVISDVGRGRNHDPIYQDQHHVPRPPPPCLPKATIRRNWP